MTLLFRHDIYMCPIVYASPIHYSILSGKRDVIIDCINGFRVDRVDDMIFLREITSYLYFHEEIMSLLSKFSPILNVLFFQIFLVFIMRIQAVISGASNLTLHAS